MKFRKTILSICAALLTGTAAATDPAPDRDPRSHAPASFPDAMDLDMLFGAVLFDRLEASFADEADTYRWDAQAWYGGDFNKVWLKTEGEGAQGEPVEEADVELLYSRNVAAFWDFQAGVRYDLRPQPEQAHLAVGFQGMAPYMFEVNATAYLREDGLFSAAFEAEYDLLITQRLILQPRVELALHGEDEDSGIGAGVTSSQAGIRLRYELRREFAPYIGFSWTQKYGDTADAARAAGEPTSINALVVGIRAWF